MKGPVECSSSGDTEYFRNLDLEFLRSYRMPNYGDTCLSIAASDGQLEVCKVLYERCPQHLLSVNRYQNTIFHHVAFYHNSTNIMCDYFIDLLWKSAGDIQTEFGFKQWLQRRNLDGETAFYRSLKSGHITEMIKYWIQVDRTYNLDLLRIPNNEGNTALHKFTALQNLEHVELLLTAEPDYIYSTNNDGELPLTIAMRLALSLGNSISADIRRLILERQPHQSTIRIGEKQWTALHHAAHICDITGIAEIVRLCPSCMEIVDANGQNYLQIAFQSGHLYRVMHVLRMNNIVVQTPLSMIDDKNNTLMHLAVEQKEFELVKWLMPGESDIGYGPNIYGETPLLIAMRQSLLSESNEDKIISADTRKYLLQMNPGQSMICTGSKSWTALQHGVHSGDIVSVKEVINICPNSVSLTDVEGRNFLHTAVSLGQIDVFMHTLKTCNIEKELLNQLDIYGKTPLGMTDNDKNTPLHLAVKYEEFEVVKLLSDASLNIPFGINIDGETPLLIATRQAQSPENVISVEIRKLLLEKHPKQSEILTGENRWTSLHYGASIGDIGVVEDILRWCPNCVELLDNEGRNFLHIAAEYKQYVVVKHVCEANDISPTILNQNDNYGNTPLHTAAQTGNRDIILCLLYKPEVDKTTSNARGQRVLDAITFDYDKERAGVYGVRDRMNDKELKDQSDFDLVVGALIATVSFTSGIMVPGGYISDGPDSGMALLSKQASFEIFAIANSFGLVFSLYAVFSHFCTRHLLKREDIIYQLNVAMLCTLAAIFSMMVAFVAGSYAVLAVSNRIAIIVCVNSGCFFIFAFRAMLRILSQHKKSTLWR